MNEIKDITYTFYKFSRLYIAVFCLGLLGVVKWYMGLKNE